MQKDYLAKDLEFGSTGYKELLHCWQWIIVHLRS